MKVAVIGGGPGGYVCAIRLAKLKAEVTLIEEKDIGGTCLNKGCIPTKALLHAAKTYKKFGLSEDIGIKADHIQLDLQKVHLYKEKVIKRLRNGIRSLITANRIEYISGRAKLCDEKTVLILTSEGEIVREFDRIVLATGSSPIVPAFFDLSLEGILTSDEALNLEEVPERLVIIGGGVIGCEFAEIFHSFGSKITMIEALPSILANLDEDLIEGYSKKLKKEGINLLTDTRVINVDRADNDLCVIYEKDGEKSSCFADKILVATGRKPNTADLGLENAGIHTDKGYIIVNKKTMQTNNEKIYAIGDIVPGLQLAHVASSEGIVCADSIMNHPDNINLDVIPSVVYSDPEIASVGMTERKAKESGINYKVGLFPVLGNGRSLIEGTRNGFVKVINDEHGRIIGVHMMCDFASEIISEAALMVGCCLNMKEIESVIHAHPTVYEALHEAIQDLNGEAIHKA